MPIAKFYFYNDLKIGFLLNFRIDLMTFIRNITPFLKQKGMW